MDVKNTASLLLKPTYREIKALYCEKNKYFWEENVDCVFIQICVTCNYHYISNSYVDIKNMIMVMMMIIIIILTIDLRH
jgi:hypothetical protein